MFKLHGFMWPWDLDSGNTDLEAEGEVWRADLGDRAGTKQAMWAHLARAKLLLPGPHHPAPSTFLAPVLSSVIRKTEILVLPLLSKLPKQPEPQFPHLCSGNLWLSRGPGKETPTMVAKVPKWGGCRNIGPDSSILSVVLAEIPHEKTIWPKCLKTKFNWDPERL